VGWQPLGGWQMSTPVAANGRQERLQQSPPQLGSVPPVKTAPPLHASPATVQPPAPEAVTVLHVPSVAPAAIAQLPPQQSSAVEHASPF